MELVPPEGVRLLDPIDAGLTGIVDEGLLDPLPRPFAQPTGAAADAALAAYDVRGYARTRNHLDGNVSGLNPYITWGALTLAEVQASVEARHGRHDADLAKFLDELGWKAFGRAWFGALGGRALRPLEPYKYPTAEKRRGPPPGAETATTGLPCIDALLTELADTGHLHNHGRLWLAAWWVHYQGHDPLDGEAFLRARLLDGEPGPNALGWQWVASTFGGKPYVFNAENMRRNGLPGCEGAPFDVSYDEIARRFLGGYGQGGYARRPKDQPVARPGVQPADLDVPPTSRPAVMLHGERLSLRARAAREHPGAPVIVALDGRRLRRERPSRGRASFALSLAADVVRVARDEGREARLILIDDESDVADAARTMGADGIVTPDSWHPGTWRTLSRLDALLPVSVIADEAYADVGASLRSFSAWWRVARPQVEARSRAQRSGQDSLFGS